MKYYLCLCFTLSAVLGAIQRSLLNISLYQRFMLFCDQSSKPPKKTKQYKTKQKNKKNSQSSILEYTIGNVVFTAQ